MPWCPQDQIPAAGAVAFPVYLEGKIAAPNGDGTAFAGGRIETKKPLVIAQPELASIKNSILHSPIIFRECLVFCVPSGKCASRLG